MRRYFQEFTDVESVRTQFAIPEEAVSDAEILIAWYGYGSYCGSAYVLFQRDGRLYEVTGSHCSCYGLEGQWDPDETSWDGLGMRPDYNPINDSADDDESAARTAFQNLVRQHAPRA